MHGCAVAMEFDVLLPTVVFFIAVTSAFLYQKLQKRIVSLFEERKFGTREAVLMVISMGLTVSVMTLIPGQAIQAIFIVAYSYIMFSFAYMALRRWYLAVFPPTIFLLSYFLYWRLLIFNTFVVIFAVVITVYLSSLFSWRTVWIFAILLTVMDIIQVFVTGHMGQQAIKMIELGLPVVLLVPTFPAGTLIGLGLGDIFLSGLLAVQTALKHGQRAGIIAAAAISIAVFVFEIAMFSTEFTRFFPATVVVVAGWLAGIAVSRGRSLIEIAPKED